MQGPGRPLVADPGVVDRRSRPRSWSVISRKPGGRRPVGSRSNGAPAFRQSWPGTVAGVNAQAAWTWPQQIEVRADPRQPGGDLVGVLHPLERQLARRRPAGPPRGSGRRRSAAAAGSPASASRARAAASCSAGSRPVADRCERVGSRPRIAVSAPIGAEPGIGARRREVAEPFLELAMAHRAGRVAVVVARDDRDPRRVDQQLGQRLARVAELVGQRRRRQVAGDQDVVGRQAAHPLDHRVAAARGGTSAPGPGPGRPSRRPAC